MKAAPAGLAAAPPGAASSLVPAQASDIGLLDFFDPGALPWALAVLIGAVLLVRSSKRLLQRLSERAVRHRLVIKQSSSLFAFAVWVIAFAWAFTMLFTLSSQAWLALSGTLAVTLGFALKDEAASFLAGLSILVNKPFQVGDRIHFGGFYGEVKEIGLRTVRLVTLDDNLVSIPSNKFLVDAVASANAGELDCMVVMRFFITPQADHRRAKEIVEEAVLASKYLYLGKPWTVLVQVLPPEHGVMAVELTAKAYVYDTRHEKAFASDVTERVLDAFQSHAIPMPAGRSAAPRPESS
ncbi:MAG: mechanosensitive ion channel [Deltaproteobacteria bacterium]|nr:mechanosensitive ion channel [Deltaproteobacteria bacterium]